MREVDLGSGRALLIKQRGEFSAIGHKCPHYGAPLVKGERRRNCRLSLQRSRPSVIPNIFLSGVLSKGHVRCPWHGACFNIATGDIEDFPGLDSLPTFQVTFPRWLGTHSPPYRVSGRRRNVCLFAAGQS